MKENWSQNNAKKIHTKPGGEGNKKKKNAAKSTQLGEYNVAFVLKPS